MKKTSLCLSSLVLAGTLSVLAPAVFAQNPTPFPDTDSIVSLSSSASVDVPKDWMAVTFSVTREGVDAASVQGALKDALGTVLTQAQRVARPDGHVEVRTGSFSLQPRLNDKGRMTGWSGSTELQVEGRDMATIAELAGRVSAMSVERLSYGLSREAREKVEGDVSAQAIARFRAKAADYAKAFGRDGYVVREVNVQTDAGQPPQPRMFAMKLASADASALPVEAGNGTVTASVNGTVRLK